MKTLLTLFFAAAAVCSASAGVVSPYLRATAETPRSSKMRVDAERAYVPAIIEVSEDAVVDSLCELGTLIFGRRGSLVLASVPRGALGEVQDLEGVIYISSTPEISACMDLARPATKVDRVQAAPEGLTGRGVTVGFCDTGFDPNHPAFRNRVRALTDFNAAAGAVTCASSPAEIADWTTDNEDYWHATHVAGIMSGADGNAPQYRGVAPGASIVATTSKLSDVDILSGLEYVIASAQAAGEPAVVNMSLSNPLGPHDGTSAFCRYLDMCADDAVIVLSAGNNGTQPVSLTHTFTAECPTAATMLYRANLSDADAAPMYADIWSATDSPIEVRIKIFDRTEHEFVFTGEWFSPAGDEGEQTLSVPFPLLSVRVASYWEINPANGRFNLLLATNALGSEKKSNGTPRYLPALDFRAAPGTAIEGFSDGSFTFYRDYSAGGALVGPQLSISDMATAGRVLSVGSINTRFQAPLLDGSTEPWPWIGDDVASSFSSYGRLRDGRSLPLVTAPGAIIVAPTSSYFLAAHPDEVPSATYRDSQGAYYAPNCGTSMSAPHVAGVCALWLEAAPWLTPDEVRQVAVATANASVAPEAADRIGAGCIDAEAGLREIKRMEAGVLAPEVEQILTIRREGTRAVATDVAGEAVAVDVFDMMGRRLNPEALPAAPVVARTRSVAKII